ncbi:MAG: GerMN domain-containing protein, partial [Desulfuromonadaceae bacterium]
MQDTRRKRIVLWVVLLVLLIAAVLLLRNFLPLPAPAPVPPKEAETVQQLREVMLYFATPDGMGLESQMSEVEGCSDEEHCLLATIQALIDGPTGSLVAVLPAQTRVQQVEVDKGVASISFSKELVAGHPGGSMTELLTVHALANTLAVNFPYIRKV